MCRRVLIGVGLLALFAAGVGVGILLQYRFQFGVAPPPAHHLWYA